MHSCLRKSDHYCVLPWREVTRRNLRLHIVAYCLGCTLSLSTGILLSTGFRGPTLSGEVPVLMLVQMPQHHSFPHPVHWRVNHLWPGSCNASNEQRLEGHGLEHVPSTLWTSAVVRDSTLRPKERSAPDVNGHRTASVQRVPECTRIRAARRYKAIHLLDFAQAWDPIRMSEPMVEWSFALDHLGGVCA